MPNYKNNRHNEYKLYKQLLLVNYYLQMTNHYQQQNWWLTVDSFLLQSKFFWIINNNKKCFHGFDDKIESLNCEPREAIGHLLINTQDGMF